MKLHKSLYLSTWYIAHNIIINQVGLYHSAASWAVWPHLHCYYITMCLCHLPVPDVDQPVIGHRQGEGGQVTTTKHIRDVGAHVLQEGDTDTKLTVGWCLSEKHEPHGSWIYWILRLYLHSMMSFPDLSTNNNCAVFLVAMWKNNIFSNQQKIMKDEWDTFTLLSHKRANVSKTQAVKKSWEEDWRHRGSSGEEQVISWPCRPAQSFLHPSLSSCPSGTLSLAWSLVDGDRGQTWLSRALRLFACH